MGQTCLLMSCVVGLMGCFGGVCLLRPKFPLYLFPLNPSLYLWYFSAAFANIAGILSIVLEWWEGRSPSGGLGLRTLQSLQYHYFFCWMQLLLGYGGIVSHAWSSVCPQRMSHVHLALIGIPVVAWLKRKSDMIVMTTQIVSSISIVSHLMLSIWSGSLWGCVAAVVMTMTVIAMSLPVRLTFFSEKVTTREAAILLAGLASLVFPPGILGAKRLK